MSASFNNTTSQNAPHSSQPLGNPIAGGGHTGLDSTHSGSHTGVGHGNPLSNQTGSHEHSTHSSNNPFSNNSSATDQTFNSSVNPLSGSGPTSVGHNNSHPSAALAGSHNAPIGGATALGGQHGSDSHVNPSSSTHGQANSHSQSGQQKEGIVDALNPKTGSGSHLPHSGGNNTSTHSHGSNPYAPGTDDRNHGQQTGNTIHGASSTPASTTGTHAAGFTESAHSSNTKTHTNLDANPNVHAHDTAKTDRVAGQEAGGLVPDRNTAGSTDHATPGLGKDLGGDSYHDQPGSAHSSSHRHQVDPRNVDTEIGAKSGSEFHHSNTTGGGGQPSVGGGLGTGENRTLPGGVKGTGGMGKRDGEDAMGGGGGIVGKIAEKLHMGHGNTKTTESDASRTH